MGQWVMGRMGQYGSVGDGSVGVGQMGQWVMGQWVR